MQASGEFWRTQMSLSSTKTQPQRLLKTFPYALVTEFSASYAAVVSNRRVGQMLDRLAKFEEFSIYNVDGKMNGMACFTS
jgi:hypothetical protein